MENKKIIIGSRGSKLALIYANRAKELIIKNEKIENVEIKSITTKGDTIKDVRVSEYGGKGLFCKAIEQAPEYLNEGGEMYICVSSFSDIKKLKETVGDKGGPIFEKNIPFSRALMEKNDLLDPNSFIKRGSRFMWTFSLWKI